MYDFTQVWNLRKQTSKGEKMKEREREREINKQDVNYKQTDGYQRGG